MTRRRIYSLVMFANIIIWILVSCNRTDNSNLRNQELLTQSPLQTLNRPEPDERGIITYETYQIIVANGQETIAEIAERLNISGEKFALYNGLIPNYRPREKEVLALHEMVSGDQVQVSEGWSNITESEITAKDRKIKKNKISPENNPLRHRIKAGETVYSIARLYNVSVNSLAIWNGLGATLDVKAGREIIIPAATKINTADKTAASAKPQELSNEKSEPVTIETVQSSETDVQTQNKVKKQITTNNSIVSVRPFISPVTGEIVGRYSQGQGTNNNNGIDYQTKALAAVVAVANGKVVLISEISGGEGKIILIKHSDEMITIYGGLTNLIIEKGDNVNQGQKIGEVIQSSDQSFGLLHFEVRRGMKSINPEEMIR